MQVTVVEFQFRDGTRTSATTINFEQWQKMMRSGEWDGKPLAFVDILQKHNDKGPNRLTFE